MSRRTFIKTWNPAAPMGGRGRGRYKKGSNPDAAFHSGVRTIHDPSVDARQPGGRDAEGSTRFYSASGLTTAGLPENEDRFRATHSLGIRGGRGKVQQRVGMFRNAIQSNVIFGGPSERVQRTTRKKMDRILAPESDVAESVSEWRRSPQRNTQRRRDVYEYDSEEEEEEVERYQPRRRVSNSRRAAVEQRRDADYDPYEFRDDDSGEEYNYQPPSRPRRPNSKPGLRFAEGASSSSHDPPVYRRERLRTRDERTQPRRLFEDGSSEEMEDYDRRQERGRAEERMDKRDRGGREERQEERMDKRTSKRPREISPARVMPAARHQVLRRDSNQRRAATPAVPPQSSVNWLREQAGIDEPVNEAANVKAANGKDFDAIYTPQIAEGIARRILSGLPKLRLKDDDGAESYLTASRSIIANALNRFTENEKGEGGEGAPPDGAAGAADEAAAAGGSGGGGGSNTRYNIMRDLMNRTQLINVSEESEEDDDEEGSEDYDGMRRCENIFSRHTRGASPVLERLFNQTVLNRGALGGEMNENQEEEEEVDDTAKMLGLAGGSEQQSGGGREMGTDQFAIVPRTAGESTSSGSNSSALSSSRFSRRSMAESYRSLTLLAAPQNQRFAAGTSSRFADYSSDRPPDAGPSSSKSFPFQMGGLSRTAHSTTLGGNQYEGETAGRSQFGDQTMLVPPNNYPPNNYNQRTLNNNHNVFDFDF